eukprot:7178365-Pyramimonas_sp.AAC.1
MDSCGRANETPASLIFVGLQPRHVFGLLVWVSPIGCSLGSPGRLFEGFLDRLKALWPWAPMGRLGAVWGVS